MGPKIQKMSADDAVENIFQFVEGGDELEHEIYYEEPYENRILNIFFLPKSVRLLLTNI